MEHTSQNTKNSKKVKNRPFTSLASRPLSIWQWGILGLPIFSILLFLLIAAGWQIHTWGISWIWAIITVVLVGWRVLFVRWTQPFLKELSRAIAVVDLQDELDQAILEQTHLPLDASIRQDAEQSIQQIVDEAQSDLPIWEDWPTFWQRCQEVVSAIAHLYHPDVKYPLLNIHIPQAYGLIRGTVDNMDQWMQRLSPVLNKVSIGQAYQAYGMYRKLEPSARKIGRVLNWGQWVWNPAAAAARTLSQPYSNQATQQFLFNFSQTLREVALRTLAQQAIALYSGQSTIVTPPGPPSSSSASLSSSPSLSLQTQTLRDLLAQANPPEHLEQQPVNILLAGRTGSGKSSVINTLFQADQATVSVLPSTNSITEYQWHKPSLTGGEGDRVVLWDTPGYEQVHEDGYIDEILTQIRQTDIVLLVTPAVDPALQMDRDFLQAIKAEQPNVPIFVLVTHIDRLRPIREWNPPYNWAAGNTLKEKSIRAAIDYRVETLGDWCDQVLPIVTYDSTAQRNDWNTSNLVSMMINAIAPAQQLRLAHFSRNQDAQAQAAAQIIHRYTTQMTTTQGMTALLKSPILTFISTLTTGRPDLAYILAEHIPVEQLPLVIGKLQMAYDLFSLLADDSQQFNLSILWPLLLEQNAGPRTNAWTFGNVLIKHWSQQLAASDLSDTFYNTLQQQSPSTSHFSASS